MQSAGSRGRFDERNLLRALEKRVAIMAMDWMTTKMFEDFFFEEKTLRNRKGGLMSA